MNARMQPMIINSNGLLARGPLEREIAQNSRTIDFLFLICRSGLREQNHHRDCQNGPEIIAVYRKEKLMIKLESKKTCY